MLIEVITISDRCSQGLMTDTAGPATASLLSQQWPAAEIRAALLPDEEDAIAERLDQASRDGAALVVTVGGTGLGPRDRTPKAPKRVLDREAPGLAEAIRSIGASVNPYAWLSRGVAGLRGTTLILNLPGSRKGAEQSLSSVMKLIQHGLDVIAGGQTHP